MTINIKVTAEMLCVMLDGKFTLDACNAICEYMEECGNDSPLMIGDIAICFSEIPAEWDDEYDEDNLIAELDNGNVLISL